MAMRLTPNHSINASAFSKPTIKASPGPGSPRSEDVEEAAGTESALDQIDRYFHRWDLNQNGQIAWSEVRANVASDQVKGEEAVALASLYALAQYDVNYRGLKRTPPISYDRLFDLYYEYDTDEVAANGEYRLVADRFVEKYGQKLAAASESLMPQGTPVAEQASQGTAPSCGFLATTFSEVFKSPKVVEEMIKGSEEDGFRVRFPGLKKTIRVEAPTDTERALFSSAGENGTWITVLEKAWGKHLAGRIPLAAFEQDTNPADAITAWTGHPAETIELPEMKGLPSDGLMPEYLRETSQSLGKEGTVVAWTKFKGVDNDDFVSGHAYSLTKIDEYGGQVFLRNPWGKKEPIGPDGKPLDGKDDGQFSLSFQEFQDNFQKLAREVA